MAAPSSKRHSRAKPGEAPLSRSQPDDDARNGSSGPTVGALNEKSEYTVGEVAELIGVGATTIRVWEHDGLVSPRRAPSGYRYFGPDEIARLRRIAFLRNVENLNTAGIRRVLAAEDEGEPKKPSPPPTQVALGPALRKIRRDRGLTLEQAGELAGLSPSFLSAVELDRTGIAQDTLLRLVNAYGVTVASILRRSGRRVARLKRADKRRAIRHHGVKMERLVDGDTVMDPSVLSVEAGADGGGSYAHAGEEFVFVLEGVFEITLDDSERYQLDVGDTLYFPSHIAHRWRNPGVTSAKVLWVNTPPTF
jgi:DNA-binding transcriptional MerR regulator